MSAFLDDDDLFALTQRTRRNAQSKVLNAMGIVHQVRPDGSVAVLWSHVHNVFGGEAEATRKTKVTEPDWAAL